MIVTPAMKRLCCVKKKVFNTKYRIKRNYLHNNQILDRKKKCENINQS